MSEKNTNPLHEFAMAAMEEEARKAQARKDHEAWKRSPWRKVEKVVGVIAIVGAVFGMLKASEFVYGKPGITKTEGQMRHQALKRSNEIIASAGPNQKFALQYLLSKKITVNKYEKYGTGLRSIDDATTNTSYRIGNACLQGSSYNIAGGKSIGYVNGLFVEGKSKGYVPSTGNFAETNPKNPNELIVNSSSEKAPKLRFTGAAPGQVLEPVDSATRKVLADNSCDTGIVGVVNEDYRDSFYSIDLDLGEE